MSCSNVQPLQKPLDNPFIDKPAGKPTYSNKSNFYKLYYEPCPMEFKTSRRNINHKNKTSMFDVAHVNRNEKVSDIIDHENSDIQNTLKKKRIIIPSSLDIKNILQNDMKNIPNEKYGKKISHEARNFHIFSEEYNNVNEKRSSKKISTYSLEKNPCKWGVDVFRYTLPSPKKIYRHIDNLSSCLIPNKSEDSIIPKKKKIHYVTNLEKSLCPKEDNIIPNSNKKLIYLHESKLDVNYVPKDYEEKKNLNRPKFYNGNLNADLTPLADNNRKPFHINTTCRNKKCSISFGCDREPSPYRPGKRIGYVNTKNENSVFLF
ncbi:conserved Plasmodium protein, unknown function [Plasmodium gallinaceum]|uniref:Uncharacterized protein n=1 Tax=Plasmodium gallinaceum TaxID=5849 RepID=A0A1J1GQA3_PLAGA|nr:conserved Plasmodium protein, unknown function [Plasmodium gallinaceum]CRG94446.1 conserved Plasmodium protein, unknown function [Plasmodium gallinaceum]